LGVGAFVGIPLFIAAIVAIVMVSFNTSDPYRLTIEHLREHPQLERRIGHPVEPSGWLTMGCIQHRDDDGRANLTFDIEGPKGRGTVEAYLIKDLDRWAIRDLTVSTEHGERLVLVETDGA